MKLETILFTIGMICLVLGLWYLVVWIVYLLWNWIMPYLFKLPEINMWMSAGIMLLASFIFGGIKISKK